MLPALPVATELYDRATDFLHAEATTHVHNNTNRWYEGGNTMAQSTAMRDELMNRDPDDLRTEHNELEKRLEALHRPRSMSPGEQSEIAQIKKRKLAIKDRLMSLDAQ